MGRTLAILGLIASCLLTQHAGAQTTGKCPAGWLSRDNSEWCYELVNNPGSFKTWSGAKSACESQHAYLLSISDMQERTWLAERINRFLSSGFWWFGLQRNSGSWQWDDGHSGDETPGTPPDTSRLLTWFGSNSDSTDGNCMSIAEDSKVSSVLYVFPRDCSKNARYICKKLKQDVTTCDADNGWMLRNGKCYKPFDYENNGAYWDDARKRCNQLEADLATISDQATNIAIRDIVNRNPGAKTFHWIGLRTYPDAGRYVWRWVDDSPLTYQAWEIGSQPAATPNLCVQTSGNVESALWRSYACSGARNGYVCARPTGTCASGWYQHRDYCYSINPRELSWNQASDTCASYSASLVQIRRDHVQEFLNEYRADFVNQRIDYIWIGMYRNVLDKGEISWTSGGLVSKGYTNWADGEPKLDNSRANAGRIYTGDDKGRWQVANPVAKGGFVCEIPLGKTPLVPTTVYPQFSCEDGWILYGRNCYKLEGSFVDWLTAQGNCRKYPGGELIDIRDQSEQEFIQLPLDRTRDYWIGLHTRSNDDRRWMWSVDEAPASYFNWMDGEPNNHEGEENCVEMYSSGLWNDNRCTYRLPYICKKSASHNGSPPTLPPTTTVNFDPFCGPLWTRDLTSSYCYMFNIETLIWVDAKHQCEYNGGRLLSIVTLEEKAFITARMQALKEGNDGILAFWTGFNDRAEEGNWIWDDGQPVAYLNWASGEPNNAGGGEDCAVIYADNAQWNDFACEKRYASICKKLGNTLITIRPPVTTIQVPDGYLRGCRAGYSGYNDMCYKVYTSPTDEVTWDEAKAKCRLDGGDLASVMSLTEQQFLQELAKPFGDFSYWIGFYDSFTQQRTMLFKWTDNSRPTFTYWFLGEPNNYGVKEDCVEIVNMWQEWKGRWNDQDCNVRRRYACKQRQIPVLVTQPITRPYGCPDGYDDAFDGYCLKYIMGTQAVTASSAKSACIANGGTLATIPTESVQNHIFLRLTELRATEDFWIGLVQNGRVFIWEDGRRFQYSNWKPSAILFGIQGLMSPLLGMWEMSITTSVTRRNYICQVRQPGITTTPGPTTSYNPAYCASGWIEADGKCYRGFSVASASDKLNWPEARGRCKTLNGDLASIHSDEAMKTLEETVGGTSAYWIGLNTRDSNKGYVWADNTPVEYFKWRDNKQPENINGYQNCGVLNPSDMSWTIENCNAAINWLCEMPKGIYPTGSTPEPTTPPDMPDCGDGWKYYNGSCYLFSATGMEWHKALQECRNKNSDLASIHDDEENNFLLMLSAKMHISLTSYWIGLNELGQTSGFRWSDGTGANYFNWNTGEPNNAGGAEHCVAFYSSNGLWNDDQCGERFRFVCKKSNDTSRTAAPATPMPGKCPREYFTVGNKCFRVYESLELQWSEARQVCESGGDGIRGYLASISNEYEQAALTAYKTSKDTTLWIGLFARYNSHQYFWHDNSPVSYSNWDYQEPNGVLEKCVHIYTEKFRAGKWNDLMCDRKMGFVCMTYKNPALVTDWQPPTSIACEAGWSAYGSACFRYEPTAVTWVGAQAACSTLGANLASIHDVWEQSYAHFLTESIAQVSTWIGLSDTKSPSTYQWVDNWPLTYVNWGRNEPRGADGTASACAYMDKTGGWFTGDCNTRLPVLCRKSYGPMPTTLPHLAGTCPNNFVPQGDSCYFVANNTVALTAQEAQYECQRRHRSNLVSILSEGEHNFVAGLVRQKSVDESRRSDYWIGLLRGSDGGFEWYDQSPLSFVYWSNGEPSNTPNENCVELYHINLRWNDHYCTKRNSYVCKMPKLPATDGPTTSGAAITTTGTRGTQTTVSARTGAPPETTTPSGGRTQGPDGGLRSIADLRDDAVVAGVVVLFLALLAAVVLVVYFYRRRAGPKLAATDDAGFINANWTSSTNEVSLETGGGGGLSNPSYKASK